MMMDPDVLTIAGSSICIALAARVLGPPDADPND
jgi:hypothetical protein